MFFVLSKILGFFTQPSNAIAVICALGALLLLTRWRRAGTRLLGARRGSLAADRRLFAARQRAAADRCRSGFRLAVRRAWRRTASSCSAARSTPTSARRATRWSSIPPPSGSSRCWSWRGDYPQARIVLQRRQRQLLSRIRSPRRRSPAGCCSSFGIAPDRIVLEDAFAHHRGERRLHPRAGRRRSPAKRWLLVTSAFHMPRSIGAFRAVGFDVEAYPVDWRTPRLGRRRAAVRPAQRRARAHRRRGARMDRADGLLAERQDQRAAAVALASAGRRAAQSCRGRPSR